VLTLNACLGTAAFTGGALQFEGDGKGGSEGKGKGKGNEATAEPDADADSTVSAELELERGRRRNHTVPMARGLVAAHAGQHRHASLPLLTGERVNLIIWLFAEHGVVRVVPYEREDQMGPQQRWRRQSRELSSKSAFPPVFS
jgi:hypothetical protein